MHTTGPNQAGAHGSTGPERGNTDPERGNVHDDDDSQPPQVELGTTIGDGLPPVPAKLVAKIVRGDFIAMHELLPECLADSGDPSKSGSKSRAKKRSQELSTWLQCYALYVGVLGPKKPERIPELMAYMATIIRASLEFEGAAWAVYDDSFRRQAETTGNWQWSRVNTSLYSMCFTGKAKKASRCDRCLSAAHRSEDCALPGDEDPDVAKRLKTIEAAVMALTQSPTTQQPRSWAAEPCRKFNWNECKFRGCKYAHRCISCRGNHPASQCSSSSAPQQQQPESVANATPLGPFRRALPQRPPAPNTPY